MWMPVARSAFSPLLIACLAALREALPLEAISLAIFITSSISWSWGTTLLANPIVSASAAEIILPVKTSSLAKFEPIRRGNLWVPPNPGIRPRLISGWPNLALSEAYMKSQAIAISVPPPRAKPFTAAITAMGSCWSLAMMAWPFWAKFLAVRELNVASSVMSAPATKDLSPEPVSTRTRIFSSAAILSSASENSSSRAGFRALRALGRLNVMVAIPSSTW